MCLATSKNITYFHYKYQKIILKIIVDLLFITNENNNHYCWLKNFDGLVSKQINKYSHKYFNCKKYMHGF